MKANFGWLFFTTSLKEGGDELIRIGADSECRMKNIESA